MKRSTNASTKPEPKPVLKSAARAKASSPMMLGASTAEELMTPNPQSVRVDATVKEAAAFLLDHHFGAAPVINAAGRPVGVIARTDVVQAFREKADFLPAQDEGHEWNNLNAQVGESVEGFQIEHVDRTMVRDAMTPIVLTVTKDTSARAVVEALVERKVHRLFVVDEDGVLVGVIGTLDVLGRLH